MEDERAGLAQADEIVLLVSQDKKHFIFRLGAGAQLHTHLGIVEHDEIIGAPLGSALRSHVGQRFVILRPSMEEILRTTKRASQILYPKDIGYVLLKLSIVPGRRVGECGTGSGALTTALATYTSPGGHVYTYENRDAARTVAMENLARLGLEDGVTFHDRDIAEGFLERDLDAIFLDLREPWLALDSAHEALAGGAFLGAIVPTLNQVIALVDGLDRRLFTEIEVCEILLREFKPVPERVRPFDRLTAHTGYLAFARKRAAPGRAEAPETETDGQEAADGEDDGGEHGRPEDAAPEA